MQETATCPLCRDYEGEPSSVEAHISAMTDETHVGETGRAHRDEIGDSVEEDGVVRIGEPHPESDGEGPLVDLPVDQAETDDDLDGSEEPEEPEESGEFELEEEQLGEDDDGGDGRQVEVETADEEGSAGVFILLGLVVLALRFFGSDSQAQAESSLPGV